ncbi:ATPase/histidine kinase/DNA gyrase B/HSP90 domain protein [Corynebacterium efficiens YS-314]|nr:ATPase/histidine kinase/DNA gyrase B/HSP90 domain protein [Corynebacterium efficiens YS-314]
MFRFLAAQVLVVAISLSVAVAVASLVGPPLFHEHLVMAGLEDPSLEQFHAEQAYRYANLITLAVALPTALICAVLTSLVLSRRLRAPLRDLTCAAAGMANGNYHVRVPVGQAGPEVDTLARAFNTMATRLEQTEQVRRQMLSDLAHEMGTPLSVLAVYLDGLQDGVIDWNTATQKVISDQLSRLTRLTEDMDEVSRVQEHRIALELAEENLAEVLSTSLNAVREAYQAKSVDLQLIPVPPRTTVVLDQQRFGQVMGNLLSNALRHTPAGGRVTVRTSQQGQDFVAIEVADTGEGMAEGQIEHIFERFYRGDTARSRDNGGSGIGLTISRALIEAHGGTLGATSPGLGAGSVFTIRLPLYPDGMSTNPSRGVAPGHVHPPPQPLPHIPHGGI